MQHTRASTTTTSVQTLTPFSNDEARWEAVVRRDRTADGAFYYAVRTTGVYCRPSCAARLARREHVRFYATCEEAEQAGFRPCQTVPTARTSARRTTRRDGGEGVSSDRGCRGDAEPRGARRAAGMSRFHFHRIFKALTGVTPKAYAVAHRAQRVRDELARSATVTEAIYGAGFHSNGRFYATSSEVLGMTPTDFRSGGHGASMRFAVGACSLGSILVAATAKGVCAILLGDDPEALVRDLQDRFPKAQLHRW